MRRQGDLDVERALGVVVNDGPQAGTIAGDKEARGLRPDQQGLGGNDIGAGLTNQRLGGDCLGGEAPGG